MVGRRALVLLLALLLAACSGLEAAPAAATTTPLAALSTVAPSAPPVITVPPVAPAQALPLPAVTTTPASLPRSASPSPVPVAFSNLRFALTPDTPAQFTFPAGTEEIYALWEYQDMAPTDRVRRIWFRDEAIWHVREEAWGAERGSQGTVRDVSVFDFEGDGLKPASYRLQLYVNDVFQGEAGFGITP